MKGFKEFIKELNIRDAAGKVQRVSKVAVRMADGKVKKMNPAKSSSSKGDGSC
jgi:hypothetical protein